MDPVLHVVLVEPEIHVNTGNIGRLCVCAGATLHLVEPLGFEITDARLRRAGLDYWPLLQWRRHPSFAAFEAEHAERGGRTWFTSGGGTRIYDEVRYAPGDALVFGRESAGLPSALLAREVERTVRIPIRPEARSLNLANAAGIVVFEALRQLRLAGLRLEARGAAPKRRELRSMGRATGASSVSDRAAGVNAAREPGADLGLAEGRETRADPAPPDSPS